MQPDFGSWNRRRRLQTVLFPAPEGPTSATVSPARTSRVKSLSAVEPGRVGYEKATLSNRIVPRGGVGSRTGLGGATIIGLVCSNSTIRSPAPAALWNSLHTSLKDPIEEASNS